GPAAETAGREGRGHLGTTGCGLSHGHARAGRHAYPAQAFRHRRAHPGAEYVTRRPVVYHIISAGRHQVSAASDLVMREGRVAVELDPEIVKAKGVFVEIDPKRLRRLDDDGWVIGYPELVDRRQVP